MFSDMMRRDMMKRDMVRRDVERREYESRTLHHVTSHHVTNYHVTLYHVTLSHARGTAARASAPASAWAEICQHRLIASSTWASGSTSPASPLNFASRSASLMGRASVPNACSTWRASARP